MVYHILRYNFLYGTSCVLTQISLKFVPKVPIDNKGPNNKGSNNLDLDKGLAEYRRHAIIWTNDGLVWLYIYASLGLDEIIRVAADRKTWLMRNLWSYHLRKREMYDFSIGVMTAIMPFFLNYGTAGSVFDRMPWSAPRC